MAGGPSDTAGSILTVTRPRQSGEIPLPGAKADPTGQFSSVELNVQDILEGKNPAANIEIKPNDIISVSEASSNMVYVVGDVQHAGAFTLGGQRNVSVLRALSLAGGLGRTAKPEKARIIHEIAGRTECQGDRCEHPSRYSLERQKTLNWGPTTSWSYPPAAAKTFTTAFLPATFSAAVGAAIYHY